MTHPASLAAPRLLTYSLLLLAAALCAAQWLWPQCAPVRDIAPYNARPACDQTLWQHVYNPRRLKVLNPCVSVTGTIVDATHGKHKQGCRVEADGDLHCWLKLDNEVPGIMSPYLNAMNLKNEGGTLVWEPMCQHHVTQKDAMEACKDWHQDIILPPVGSHVKITGAWVLDTEHGHMEIHPVSGIEVLP